MDKFLKEHAEGETHMNDKVQLYEELSLNAHPSLQTQVYDRWILEFVLVPIKKRMVGRTSSEIHKI